MIAGFLEGDSVLVLQAFYLTDSCPTKVVVKRAACQAIQILKLHKCNKHLAWLYIITQ